MSKSSKKIRAYFPVGTPVEYDMPFGQPPRKGSVMAACSLAEGMWWVQDDEEGHQVPIPESSLRVICWIV